MRLAGEIGGLPARSAWSAVPAGTQRLVAGLVDAGGHTELLLVGAEDELALRLGSGATAVTLHGGTSGR